MDAEAFKAQWRGWYGNAPPIGHVLRRLHPEAWLRIHSLPESKRYAQTQEQWTELLARHNTVATTMLGDGSPCILVTPRFSGRGKPMPKQLAPALQRLGKFDDSWPGATALRDSIDPDVEAWLYAQELTWRRGALDAQLRAAANDETRFLLVSCISGQVYAPYDGGADLFFRSDEERSRSRKRYRDWLSPRPDGL